MADGLLESTKKNMRSVLISTTHSLSAVDIERDYALLTGERLPYRELGYARLAPLLDVMKVGHGSL